MTTNPMIKLAADIAVKAHKGQLYGGLDYFTVHCIGVAREIEKHMPVGMDPVHAKMAALLHDVLEDDPESSPSMMMYQGVPAEVVQAVINVTKEEGYDEDQYFERIRNNPLALAVKLADMTFNFSNSIRERNPKRVAKYARQIQKLIPYNG